MDPIAHDDTSGSHQHEPMDPKRSIEDPNKSAYDKDESGSEEEVSDAVHGRNVRRVAVPLATARW